MHALMQGGMAIQEGAVFHADTHRIGDHASEYLRGRRAACRTILARDYERDREYINYEFGWFDPNERIFRRVRYLPARWAEEFIEAMRKAQDHVADHEHEIKRELGDLLDKRMREAVERRPSRREDDRDDGGDY